MAASFSAICAKMRRNQNTVVKKSSGKMAKVSIRARAAGLQDKYSTIDYFRYSITGIFVLHDDFAPLYICVTTTTRD
jgi:hypothetical protein